MQEYQLNKLNSLNKSYKLYTDVIEDGAMEQFIDCMQQPSVVQGALMADTHKGYVAPIGSVLATKGTIFPSFVGYDIGCGMSEAKLDIKSKSLSIEDLSLIKDEILKRVPIGLNRHRRSQPVSRSLRDMDMTDIAKDIIRDQGGTQIGTLGGGNHFLEIGTTDDGSVSIVVHCGSRGVGYKIATHYMKLAAIQNTDESRYIQEFHDKNTQWKNHLDSAKASHSNDKKQDDYDKACKEFVYRRVRARVSNIEDAYPLDVTSNDGIDYINDMNMALQYAIDNRTMIIENVIKAISTVTNRKHEVIRFINKNHNHAELEDGRWIHRKGATQAHEGTMGVIPGNMVDGSFIVRGKGSQDSMNSSSHGAGRVLSRRQAKDTLDLDEFNECTKHLVANHSDSNLDEAPKAYKNIFEVMDNQQDLVDVVDRVIPILNIKG